MELLVAKSGFCFGIKRAYKEINQLSSLKTPITVGHQCKVKHKNVDWDVLHRIEAKDPDLFNCYPLLEKIPVVHDFTAVSKGDHIAIGHHGIPIEIREDLEKRGVIIHDFQCPFIKKMDVNSERLSSEGYDIIAFGKPANHHCIYASKASLRHGRECLITEDVSQIEQQLQKPNQKWACVAQVTGNVKHWNIFIEELKNILPTVKIIKTICNDSHERQKEAADLAMQADLVIVVDDGGAASTSVLETCLSVNPNTVRYNLKEPLSRDLFFGVKRTAVVGGILVPQWMIDSVSKEIEKLVN